MPQICSACRHRRRPEIERRLLAGEPLRNIAKRVSLSATALFRHKVHIEKRLLEAREREETAQDRDLGQELVRLARRADGLASKAECDGDYSDLMVRIFEINGGLPIAIARLLLKRIDDAKKPIPRPPELPAPEELLPSAAHAGAGHTHGLFPVRGPSGNHGA
jgi:hypothetical protein